MLTSRVAALFMLLCAAIPGRVWGHSMSQAALLLDFHGGAGDAELQLPADRLRIATGNDHVIEYVLERFSASAPDGRRFRIEAIAPPVLSTIEGARYVVVRLRLVPPSGAGSDRFDLRCGVLLDRIPSQVILVSIRADWRAGIFANAPQMVAVLRGSEQSVRVDRAAGNWLRGFQSVFALGMRHIAEGTDHLLFLLALLLPAPLLAVRARWSGCAGIRQCLSHTGTVVSAFTVGHSATLAAGAMNLVHVPSRPIEVLIAASILVSAVHALRPIFPGREAIVAGCFGLVHGMAFATTLADLGLGRWERVAGIFGFNAGIEAMQLVVVAAALPSLILLSRTRLYTSIRTAGALFAGAAAAAWVLQRLWDVANPADAVVTAAAQNAVWIAGGLTLLGVVAGHFTALRVDSFEQMQNRRGIQS